MKLCLEWLGSLKWSQIQLKSLVFSRLSWVCSAVICKNTVPKDVYCRFAEPITTHTASVQKCTQPVPKPLPVPEEQTCLPWLAQNDGKKTETLEMYEHPRSIERYFSSGSKPEPGNQRVSKSFHFFSSLGGYSLPFAIICWANANPLEPSQLGCPRRIKNGA